MIMLKTVTGELYPVIPAQATSCLRQDEHGSHPHAVKKWIYNIQDP